MENIEDTLDRMEQWACNLADRFISQNEHVLDSVCVLAACKFIARVARRNPELFPGNERVVALLQGELDRLPVSIGKA